MSACARCVCNDDDANSGLLLKHLVVDDSTNSYLPTTEYTHTHRGKCFPKRTWSPRAMWSHHVQTAIAADHPPLVLVPCTTMAIVLFLLTIVIPRASLEFMNYIGLRKTCKLDCQNS